MSLYPDLMVVFRMDRDSASNGVVLGTGYQARLYELSMTQNKTRARQSSQYSLSYVEKRAMAPASQPTPLSSMGRLRITDILPRPTTTAGW